VTTSARNAYLTTQVMTATPQKLQLMLIDAAIRAAERTQTCWEADDAEAASQSLLYCQQIVGELLAAVASSQHALSKKLAAVYLYIYRTLIEAQLESSNAKLRDALKVLRVERETWKIVCERFGSQQSDSRSSQAGDPATPSGAESSRTSASSPNQAPRSQPVVPPTGANSVDLAGGFSLEA